MLETISKFFSETKTELSKVTWPKRNDSIKLAFYVTVSTIIAALVIAGIDFVFSKGVEWIIGIK